MKKKISIILGIVFSSLFLFLALRNVDFKSIASIYSRINPWSVAVLAVIIVVEIFLRGIRWRLLLRPIKKVKLADTFRLEVIGLALNNILPLRLGEVGRATLGGNIMGIPFIACISTILVERMMDMISLFVVFIVASQVVGVPWMEHLGNLSWLILAFPAGGLAVLVFLDELLAHSRTFSSALTKFPRLDRIVRQIALGAEALRNWKLALPIFALGFGVWFLDAVIYYLAGMALGLTPALDYWHSLVLLCMVAAFCILPAVPGYWGTFESAMKWVLSGWGVPETSGVAFAGFVHITVYIVITGLGVIFLYQAGHSLKGIWRSLKERK